MQSHPCSQACVIIEMPELFYKRDSWSFITWRQSRRRGHQIRARSNLWSLKIQPRVILFSSNCRVRRKRDWLGLFTARKNCKRPAISCHLPGKNQMQGNKGVMGNFNLNKWVHVFCTLALHPSSELTPSWLPQQTSGSAASRWAKAPSSLGCRAPLLPHGQASMPHMDLFWPH